MNRTRSASPLRFRLRDAIRISSVVRITAACPLGCTSEGPYGRSPALAGNAYATHKARKSVSGGHTLKRLGSAIGSSLASHPD